MKTLAQKIQSLDDVEDLKVSDFYRPADDGSGFFLIHEEADSLKSTLDAQKQKIERLSQKAEKFEGWVPPEDHQKVVAERDDFKAIAGKAGDVDKRLEALSEKHQIELQVRDTRISDYEARVAQYESSERKRQIMDQLSPVVRKRFDEDVQDLVQNDLLNQLSGVRELDGEAHAVVLDENDDVKIAKSGKPMTASYLAERMLQERPGLAPRQRGANADSPGVNNGSAPTPEDINNMSQAEYNAWRDAGGNITG